MSGGTTGQVEGIISTVLLNKIIWNGNFGSKVDE